MTPTSSLLSLNFAAATCSLTVTGQVAAVSQFSQQPILKRLRFQLQIFPPSAEGFRLATTAAESGLMPLVTISGQADQLSRLETALQGYVQTCLSSSFRTPAPEPVVPGSQALLQPLSLTRHRLAIAQLQATATVPSVDISSLQLSDLADVLSQMAASVRILPESVGRASQRRHSRSTLGIASVAAAFVAVVTGIRLLPIVQPTISQAPEQTAAPPSPEALREQSQAAAPGTALPNYPSVAAGESPPVSSEPGSDTAPKQQSSRGPETPPSTQPDGATWPLPSGSSTPERPNRYPRGIGAKQPEAAPPAASNTGQRSGNPAAGHLSNADGAAESAPVTEASPELSAPTAAADGSENLAPATANQAYGEDTSGQAAPLSTSVPASEAARSEAIPAPANWQAALAAVFAQAWINSELASGPARPEPISYSVVIGANGRLQSITPLTPAAESAQSDLQLPPVGYLVAQPGPSGTQRVKVQFSPTGQVTIEVF